MTILADYTFYYCENLQTVNLPDSITEIGLYAFGYCPISAAYYNGTKVQWNKISRYGGNTALTSKLIYLKEIKTASLKSYPTQTEYTLGQSLNFDGAVIEITLYDGTKQTVSSDHLVCYNYHPYLEGTRYVELYYDSRLVGGFEITYTANTDLDWSYDSGSGALTITGTGAIPKDSTGVSMPWYDLRTKVYSIVISEGITDIGEGAFDYMYYVRSVDLPSTLRTIGESAFYRCSKLEEIIIPENVREIGKGAFAYCLGLESVSVPVRLRSVPANAFFGCDNITKVYYAGSASAWSNLYKGDGNDPIVNATVFTDFFAT